MNKKNSNSGFTLVELLASIVIFAFVSTSIFHFFILATNASTQNNQTLVAMNVARGVIEQMKYSPYEDIIGDGLGAGTYNFGSCEAYYDTLGEPNDVCVRYAHMFNDVTYDVEIIIMNEAEVENITDITEEVGIGFYSFRVIVSHHGTNLTAMEGAFRHDDD